MFYLRRSNNIIVNNISVYFKKWMQIKNKKVVTYSQIKMKAVF